MVTTQAFAFSRFKNQTPILSLWQEKIYFNNVYSTGALSQLISKIAKALINSLWFIGLSEILEATIPEFKEIYAKR